MYLYQERNKALAPAVLESMKRLFLRRYLWFSLGGFVSLVVLSSTAVHPFGGVKQSAEFKASGEDLTMPIEVRALFVRSCMDCHSNQTVWPWYSYVAPMSWLIERDVREGRDHLNVSEWHQYTLEQQKKLLAEIATEVKNREMPLPQYTLAHRNAKLSDAETDILYGWARIERRRLKTPPVVRTIVSAFAASR